MPTLDEAIALAGNAARNNAKRADAMIGNGREEPQSIKDDLVQRLYAVDTTLIILNERLGYLADRIMGQDPETDALTEKVGTSTQIVPPMIHQLSDGITTLERQAATIERTINRFNGLV
jgi:hypothetical protein